LLNEFIKDIKGMDDSERTKQMEEKAWWHWVVFGVFTPFFRAHGFRDLSKRESIGLIALSMTTITLIVLAFLEFM